MPLELQPQLRDRLVAQLTERLERATVLANYVILTQSMDLASIRSLPDKGELAEALRAYIGESPFDTFVESELKKFRGRGPILGAEEKPLAEVPEFGAPSRIAREVVDRFDSLPWQYELSVRLPNAVGGFLATNVGRFDLSPHHRLVTGADLRAFPLRHRRKSLDVLGLANQSAWEDDATYFQVSMSGYVDGQPTEPFYRARESLSAFFGLGIALGLFIDRTSRIRLGPDIEEYLVHRLSHNGWLEHHPLEVEEFHELGFHRVALATREPDKLRSSLDAIATVLRAPAGANIALAARWLFDSYCGQDALLQYVQAAVAIEILLGDENADPDVGLTALMANRCAYLIAKTPDARGELIKLFREIYKVRSKIVHRGKNRLNRQEQQLFLALRDICRSVIRAEQELLARAEQQRAK
ncbi:MAG TPA: hypothetical protein VD865_17200 [Stenotrophomonas sp.]|nr:hypothetical protein [Stenotrophomonas sp.]